MLKTLTSGLVDLCPRVLGRRQPLLVLGVLTVSMVLTLPFITQASYSVLWNSCQPMADCRVMIESVG